MLYALSDQFPPKIESLSPGEICQRAAQLRAEALSSGDELWLAVIAGRRLPIRGGGVGHIEFAPGRWSPLIDPTVGEETIEDGLLVRGNGASTIETIERVELDEDVRELSMAVPDIENESGDEVEEEDVVEE